MRGMRLILVRHGVTKMNIHKVFQHTDEPLSAEGLNQIAKVANRLRHEHIDVIFVSSILRAQRTAEEIAKYHPGIAMHVDRRLDEREAGVFRGRPYSDMEEAIACAGISMAEFVPAGGESWNAVAHRTMDFFHDVFREQHGKNVLVVGHGGSVTSIVRHVLKWTAEKEVSASNTGVSIFNISDQSCTVELLDCTKHLQS